MTNREIRLSNQRLIKSNKTRFQELKAFIVSRMFWGRSSFYRNFTLSIMVALTLVISLSGLVYKVSGSSNTQDLFYSSNLSVVGQYDLLEQGGSIETVIRINPDFGIKIRKHTVKEAESLESIAKDYNVTVDTIRWASQDVINIFTNDVEVGWELSIPEINGVLYKVKEGQNIQAIINDTGGNEFDIVEFNDLEAPYNLVAGQYLFVPNGNLFRPDVDVTDIPRGVFKNPLSNPACKGYAFSRGFLSYHNGVDLAIWTGCPISAAANGYVSYAGWSPGGQGYNVVVDHGGGIYTHYYHGDGTFWVKTGDRVQQGQALMYMGCTGNCTGTHLHFSLFKDGVAVNPFDFVPYCQDYMPNCY